MKKIIMFLLIFAVLGNTLSFAKGGHSHHSSKHGVKHSSYHHKKSV